MIRQHLLDVICSGNESDYCWLVGWLARAVQHPDLHAEVAVVLRGQKGTGKGTLGQILDRLFRHHAMQISNPHPSHGPIQRPLGGHPVPVRR
jgi:Mesyanzhinovviridae DNA primase